MSPIDGLEDVDYLTSQDALYLRETPESLVILGGGYIAVELGYFSRGDGDRRDDRRDDGLADPP